MDSDPCALLPLPPPTSSQQKTFQTHQDLLQQLQGNEVQVEQSTTIVAVSHPSGLNDDNAPYEDDEFQTASENSQSQHSSSQEHGAVIPILDLTRCDESSKKRRIEVNLNVEMEIEDDNSGRLNVVPVRVPTQTVCENVTKNIGARRELPSSITGKEKDVGNDRNLNDRTKSKEKVKSAGGLNVLNDLMKTKEKNVEGGSKDVSSCSAVNKEGFNDIFVALQRVVTDGDYGHENSDEDFLEIAKKRGMNFPRPRWWPPEGFGNDDD